MRPPPRVLLAALALLLPLLTARAHAPAVEMVAAANSFLGSLKSEQKAKATYPLTDAERENWNFVPIARQGLPLKEMTSDQHDLAIALLRSGLGQRGYLRATTIMSLELILRELENNPTRRDPMLYFVTVFGEPSGNKSWGWRFEGHHLSFNFTIVNGVHVFCAPTFIGSNPAQVRAGPRQGERVLAEEEDFGLALINALDAGQRKTAVFADVALKEIVTTNKKRIEPLSPEGLAAAAMNPSQRAKLEGLVRLYLDRWRPEVADETMAKIKAADFNKVTFAWAGGFDRSKQTYYRIQGPTFLIEFDNSQGNGNHIHTTFRDFKGDFGHDLLRDHYLREHKK
ncbi:MAG: hypothetical protein RIQ93_1606 [Verrucomicrobiota bacterium]|jgi:hypothetical protein